VLEGTDTNKSLSSLSPFLLSKALQAAIGTVTSVKRFCTGHILVTTDNPTYSQKLVQLTELAGVPIKASPHRTLNNSKGVVGCGELKQCSNEEIVNELTPQGVANSVSIKPKDDTVSNTFILSFNTPTPKIIKVGYFKKPVNIYIPNPVTCFQCQKFGHGQRSCSGSVVCARCSEAGHTADGCQKELTCAGCGGPHMASSRECSKWKSERQVQELRVKEGISAAEARRLAAPGHTGQATLISIVKNKPKTYQSVCVQTDFGSEPSQTESPPKTVHTVSDPPSNTSNQPPRPPRSQSARGREKRKHQQHSPEASTKKPATTRIKLNRPPQFTNNPILMFNKYGVYNPLSNPSALIL